MIRLRVLGSLTLERDDGNAVGPVLVQSKLVALLSYLAVGHKRTTRSRDSLIGLLWPESEERDARRNLRQALYELRRSLGRDAITGLGEERVGVDPELLWCDAEGFQEAVAEDRLEDALALYDGPLLEGFHLSGAPAFERWLTNERRRLKLRAVEAAGRLASRAETEGDDSGARRWMERARKLVPYDEACLRRYLKLLVRQGDRPAAVQAYRRYARRIADDLDLEPSAGTRKLMEQIRGRDPQLSDTWGGSSIDSGQGERRPRIHSLAVLPLEDLSEDPGDDYLAAGIHEALITELGKLGDLAVTSRTSSMLFSEVAESIPQIAEALGVDALIEGSVLRTGDHVRIFLRLVHGPGDRQVWSKRYERELGDLRMLQADVARAIAAQIQQTLAREDKARLAQARHVDPGALTLHLRGSYELTRGGEGAFHRALQYFQRAIDIDSTYAPPYAGLALTYIELGSWMASLPPRAVYAQARETVLTALERDSTLADAHIALGRIKHLFEWDWAGADASFRRGMHLDPGASHALYIYLNYLVSMGRFEEAVEVGRQLVERDPLSSAAHCSLGWALEHAGRDGEALGLYRKSLELPPHPWYPYLTLAEFHLKRDQDDEAYDYAARGLTGLQGRGSPTLLALFGHVCAKAGRPAEALKILGDLEGRAETGYVPPGALAALHVGLGHRQEALDALETGFEVRDVTSVWHKVRWIWDPLRDESRFQELVRQMDFPN